MRALCQGFSGPQIRTDLQNSEVVERLQRAARGFSCAVEGLRFGGSIPKKEHTDIPQVPHFREGRVMRVCLHQLCFIILRKPDSALTSCGSRSSLAKAPFADIVARTQPLAVGQSTDRNRFPPKRMLCEANVRIAFEP